MNFKKRVNGSWVNIPCYTYKTSTEAVENPLYSDGTAITAYTIKGNTVQNGTPTPSNPVEVNGVGVRTENLFDISSAVRYEYVITNTSPGTIKNGTLSPYAGAFCYVIKALPGVTYTLKVHTSDAVPVIRAGFYSLPVPSREDEIVHDGTEARNRIPNPTIKITNSGNYPCLILQMSGAYVPFLTITVGSTPPASFIPYGYKIPISSGGVTTNIYLGSTQTARQVKKLVLTGNENIFVYSGFGYIRLSDGLGVRIAPYSDKLLGIDAASASMPAFSITQRPSDITPAILAIKADSNFPNANAFKTWLAENQITVWYVLATPETGIVNEPLMKIGEYADTVSNAASIPTTGGANSITVDTTVQPSEFTATWTGWHDSSVKEYVGGHTVNLFDDTNVINVADLGERYGVILPSGTYSIYNDTDNNVYYGTNNWAGRQKACDPHSTATIELDVGGGGAVGGFFMPLNSDSQGGCTIVEGSTPPDHYIPYYTWVDD